MNKIILLICISFLFSCENKDRLKEIKSKLKLNSGKEMEVSKSSVSISAPTQNFEEEVITEQKTDNELNDENFQDNFSENDYSDDYNEESYTEESDY